MLCCKGFWLFFFEKINLFHHYLLPLPLYLNPAELSILELVLLLQKRPRMFLGNDLRLSSLNHLLGGFGVHAKEKEGMVTFRHFTDWILYKFRKYGGAPGWAGLILITCDQDEEKAFSRFFELLDEFLKTKPLAIYHCRLAEDNFVYYYNTAHPTRSWRLVGADNREVLTPAPYEIRIVTFSVGAYMYYYDYDFAIGQSDRGYYCSDGLDTLRACKEICKAKYGVLNWKRSTKVQPAQAYPLLSEARSCW